MGAWGVEPFDNDDACDWAYELEGADVAAGVRIVGAALEVGAPGEYLEAPDGASAVAAAAVVSWMRDPSSIPESAYGEAAAVWVRNAGLVPSADLVGAALAALGRVRSVESELAELWAESDAPGWEATLAALEARLRA